MIRWMHWVDDSPATYNGLTIHSPLEPTTAKSRIGDINIRQTVPARLVGDSADAWINLWLMGALTVKRSIGGIQTNERNATVLAQGILSPVLANELHDSSYSISAIAPTALIVLPKSDCLPPQKTKLGSLIHTPTPITFQQMTVILSWKFTPPLTHSFLNSS